MATIQATCGAGKSIDNAGVTSVNGAVAIKGIGNGNGNPPAVVNSGRSGRALLNKPAQSELSVAGLPEARF